MVVAAMASAIPAVPGLPLVGSLFTARRNRLDLWMQVRDTCGDIGQVRMGNRALVLVSSPELIHAVLVEYADRFEKSPRFRTVMEPILGNGLVTSENAFHKRQRKLVAPAFQHRQLVSLAPLVSAAAEQRQRQWQDGEVIDLSRQMMHVTLQIVGQALFSADLLGEARELGEMITLVMRHTSRELERMVSLPTPLSALQSRRYQRAVKRLDQTVERLITERRTGTQQNPPDLLSLLLEAQDQDDGARMNDQQVRDEAMTLLQAGHETTANALSWAWYLLTQHPAIYTRLQEEVDQVLGSRVPEIHDLARLPYTLQVLKEALRLYPPVHFLGRVATRPVDLGGYAVPTGTIVAISPYMMHHRADFFPDPMRFNPERFRPEVERSLPRYAFMPFGGGPRICIGNHFALMEGQLLLATLARAVTFEALAGSPMEAEPLITLRPKGVMRMRVHRRMNREEQREEGGGRA